MMKDENMSVKKNPQEDEGGGVGGVADKILRRNILNIVRKVQDGKTLSNVELSVVQGYIESSDADTPIGLAWVQNQTDLARELGVNRKTIQRWLKIEGCPQTASDGRYNVTEWRKWASDNNFKVSGGDDDESKLKLEAKRLLLINQKLEFDMAIKRGEYTHNDDVETMFVMMVQNAKKVLLALPSNASPQVVGLSVPEAEIRLREIVDEALSQLQRQWNE
jgi:hypothetical protein